MIMSGRLATSLPWRLMNVPAQGYRRLISAGWDGVDVEA